MSLPGIHTSDRFLPDRIAAAIKATLLPETPVYLVGGAIRDMLRGHPTHDLDFTLPGDAILTARRVANLLEADFYALDQERDTGRVIFRDPSSGRMVIDFSAMRGPDLESDLRSRDFTINAMALDIRQPDRLLDPLGGARDLLERVLQACSPASLTDDPIRILRAVRQSIDFDLKIAPETIRLLRSALPGLARASPERGRDELFRILDGKSPASAIRLMDTLGTADYILPELKELKDIAQPPPHVEDAWNHSLAVVQRLVDLLGVLTPEPNPEVAANWALGLVSLRLGRYRQNLHHHLSVRINPDRSLPALIILAALYHDVAKPQSMKKGSGGEIHFYNHDQLGASVIRKRAETLRLSRTEVERLETIVQAHMRPLLLLQTGIPPSRRAIYRFFRDTNAAGVDVCLLSLSDMLATYGPKIPQELWVRQVGNTRKLLEAWWEQPEEKISPPTLLNGDDILKHFRLEPGPLVGRLIEDLREAQAAGEINSHDEALSYLGKRLAQG